MMLPLEIPRVHLQNLKSRSVTQNLSLQVTVAVPLRESVELPSTKHWTCSAREAGKSCAILLTVMTSILEVHMELTMMRPNICTGNSAVEDSVDLPNESLQSKP